MSRELQQMMSILQSPDGLKNAMLQPSFETEGGGAFSQAELVADVVNIMRMDTKRIGLALGVEVEVNQMTPEYAAELLQGVAKGESTELVEVFDSIEDKRMEILEAITDEETVEQWMGRKVNLLYTTGGLDSEAVAEEVATDDVETDFDPGEAAEAAHDAMQELTEAATEDEEADADEEDETEEEVEQ